MSLVLAAEAQSKADVSRTIMSTGARNIGRSSSQEEAA